MTCDFGFAVASRPAGPLSSLYAGTARRARARHGVRVRLDRRGDASRRADVSRGRARARLCRSTPVAGARASFGRRSRLARLASGARAGSVGSSDRAASRIARAASPDAPPSSSDLPTPAADELVLVVGGAGRVGARVVRRLAAMGVRVRVMTRDVHSVAAELAALGAEIVPGDVTDPDPARSPAPSRDAPASSRVSARSASPRLATSSRSRTRQTPPIPPPSTTVSERWSTPPSPPEPSDDSSASPACLSGTPGAHHRRHAQCGALHDHPVAETRETAIREPDWNTRRFARKPSRRAQARRGRGPRGSRRRARPRG